MTHEVRITERRDLVIGMWKFKEGLGLETLTAMAAEWKKARPYDYVDLHVRKCSKDQLGIGFKFRLLAPSKRAYDQFFHGMRDRLKVRFGDDFIGWDVSNLTFVIE